MEKTKTSKDKDWTQRAQVQVLKLDRKEIFFLNGYAVVYRQRLKPWTAGYDDTTLIMTDLI